jgi:RNA polymerase sporulation-specific sigma factor
VEKSVENVEKFCFSTDKPAFTNKRQTKMVDIFLHNPHYETTIRMLRHRKKSATAGNFLSKKLAKSEPVSDHASDGSAYWKKVCGKPPNLRMYHLPSRGNNGSRKIHTRRKRMPGKVEICGVNTAKLKTLSQAQMDVLLRRARLGDESARQQLIEGNLRLVLSVIQRFDKRGESPDDLFQVGCIGLMKAIANFDPDKQLRFSTYGVPMIAGEVRRYLRDNSVIRVSRSIRDTAYRVLQCKEAMMARMDREPTLEEIAKELDLPMEEVSQAMDAVCAPVSLHDPVYSDGGDPLTVMDQVRDTKNTENQWMERIALRNAFSALQDREKEILSMRFVGGKTQTEVATYLGISQAQVSRLEKGAISAMRKQISVS